VIRTEHHKLQNGNFGKTLRDAGNFSGVALGLSLTAGDYNGQAEMCQLH